MTPEERSLRAAERPATAHHEAGHAWYYWRRGIAVRYVSLRPRDGSLGLTVRRTPGRESWPNLAENALAGIVAEALYQQRESEPEYGLEPADYITGAWMLNRDGDSAILAGSRQALAAGSSDVAAAIERHQQEQARFLWESLAEAWPLIEEAAALILSSPRATSGRALFAAFDRRQ